MAPTDVNGLSSPVRVTQSSASLGGGVDLISGLPYSSLLAPKGASVVSPLSTVAYFLDNKADLARALRLDKGDNAISPDLDILTFNPVEGLSSTSEKVRQDAARLTSLNIQLMALGILLRHGGEADMSVTLGEPAEFISDLYQERGPLDFTDPEIIRSLLSRSQLSFYKDPIQGWICNLVANYFKAIPPRISEPEQIRAWILTFRFIIIGRIKGLNYMQHRLDQFSLNSQEIANFKNYFESAPALIPHQFLAITDYREIYPYQGSTIRVSECIGNVRLPTCNDSPFSEGFRYSQIPTAKLKSAVFENQSRIRAKMVSDQEMFIEKQDQYNGTAPFYGMTYFDYTVEQDGVQGKGRTYVYFWPELAP